MAHKEQRFVRELNALLERALNDGVDPGCVVAACLSAAGQVSATAVCGSESDGVAMTVAAAKAMADAHIARSVS